MNFSMIKAFQSFNKTVIDTLFGKTVEMKCY